MKTTYMTAAQGLLLLAACLPAAAQAGVNPNHSSPAQISASAPESQIRTLKALLEGYQRQLEAKADLVERSRQEAISAGVVGDGAGPIIDAYRQELEEMEALQTALTPKIEQTRTLIASLEKPVLPADSSPSRGKKPAQPVSSAAGNSHQRKQTEKQMAASHDTSKVNPAGR
jgi:hypothetical protein